MEAPPRLSNNTLGVLAIQTRAHYNNPPAHSTPAASQVGDPQAHSTLEASWVGDPPTQSSPAASRVGDPSQIQDHIL